MQWLDGTGMGMEVTGTVGEWQSWLGWGGT